MNSSLFSIGILLVALPSALQAGDFVSARSKSFISIRPSGNVNLSESEYVTYISFFDYEDTDYVPEGLGDTGVSSSVSTGGKITGYNRYTNQRLFDVEGHVEKTASEAGTRFFATNSAGLQASSYSSSPTYLGATIDGSGNGSNAGWVELDTGDYFSFRVQGPSTVSASGTYYLISTTAELVPNGFFKYTDLANDVQYTQSRYGMDGENLYIEGRVENGGTLLFQSRTLVSLSSLDQGDTLNINYAASTGFLFGNGATASNAILPSDTLEIQTGADNPVEEFFGPDGPASMGDDPVAWLFEDAETDRWYDPDSAYGFLYQIEGDGLFTEIIDFADGFNNPFEVWVEGESLGLFDSDEGVDFATLFGSGVDSFAVTGLDPLVDGENPLAFPIQLGFDSNSVSFSQLALVATVPEPGYLVIIVAGVCGIWLRRRR